MQIVIFIDLSLGTNYYAHIFETPLPQPRQKAAIATV